MSFQSTKTFEHVASAAFRQWRAKDSHCRFVHGYALSFKLVFEADLLDDRNWVIDFGGLKEIKKYIEDTFDHKLVVARDDPGMDTFLRLEKEGLAELSVVDHTGCEQFAFEVFLFAERWLKKQLKKEGWNRVRLVSVECFEHGANSALYADNYTEDSNG